MRCFSIWLMGRCARKRRGRLQNRERMRRVVCLWWGEGEESIALDAAKYKITKTRSQLLGSQYWYKGLSLSGSLDGRAGGVASGRAARARRARRAQRVPSHSLSSVVCEVTW